MNTRNELQTLRAGFKIKADANEAMNMVFWEEQSQVEQRTHDLKVQIILEENLLKTIKWTLAPNGVRVYLSAEEDSLQPNDEIKPLIELTLDGHYSNFELMEGVTLHLSDGDITINFEDPRQITDFVEKFQLAVDTSRIREEANKLQNVVDSLWRLHTYVSAPYAKVPTKEISDP